MINVKQSRPMIRTLSFILLKINVNYEVKEDTLTTFRKQEKQDSKRYKRQRQTTKILTG